MSPGLIHFVIAVIVEQMDSLIFGFFSQKKARLGVFLIKMYIYLFVVFSRFLCYLRIPKCLKVP